MSLNPFVPPKENEPSPTSQGPTRRRIRRACEPCRHRKVKCDGGFPCAVCVGYGYDCAYPKSESVTDKSKSSTPNQPPRPASRSHDEAFESPGTDVLEPEFSEPRETKKRLYMLSEEFRSSQTLHTRFTRVDSAIAFPRSLGVSLNVHDLPRLHSFAWNTGTRPERSASSRSKLFDYVAMKDLETYSDVYFTTIHPIFGTFERTDFAWRSTRAWATSEMDVGFETIVCGVLALGSLYSTSGVFQYESEVLEQGRLALDLSLSYAGVKLSVDFVVGWILRTLYLRSTTRPHISWMASNMGMHIAESIGLHQEISDVKTTSTQPRIIAKGELETRRRTFWVACCINRYFANHYGRTRIKLQNVGCIYPNVKQDKMATDFIDLVRMLPLDSANTPVIGSIPEVLECLTKLSSSPVQARPLILFRTDIAFCMYRKIRYLNVTLAPFHTELLLSIIRSGLAAAQTLGREREQWWTILSVPFHSVCVLIAIGTAESLSILSEAMETLQNVTEVYNTHLAREALQTARYLVKGTEAKKKKELESIQRSLNLKPSYNGSAASSQLGSSEGTLEVPSFEWPTDLDLGWSAFLDFTQSGDEMGIAADLMQPQAAWPVNLGTVEL